MDKEPVCVFEEKCCFRSFDKCLALREMPKPLKDGRCPFSKECRDQIRRD